jgi:hypothetical protein
MAETLVKKHKADYNLATSELKKWFKTSKRTTQLRSILIIP